MASPRQAIFGPNPATTSLSGVPWAPWYTGPRTTTRTLGASAAQTPRPRFIQTANGIAEAPSHWTDEEVRQYTAMWDAKVKEVTDALAKASGWEREKLRLELEDALKGRENAYKIAELQSNTSRYGTDKNYDAQMARLTEDSRQFDLNHGLDRDRLQLDVVKTGVDYLSTPDRAFMYGDLQEGLGRAGLGLGPQPYGTNGQPHMKTWEDFAALSGFGANPAVQAGQSGATMAATGAGAAPPGGGGDPRVKAATGILKAIPISDGQGMDDDDFAALNAIENVFRASKPGSYERMRPGQQAMFRAGLGRLGYWGPDALKQMRRNAPGQQASALA